MKTFEVILKRPTKIKDWCIYDNKDYYRSVPTTTAIITAFSQERLIAKIKKMYGNSEIISVKEVNV